MTARFRLFTKIQLIDVEFVPFIAEGNDYFLIKATHCVDMLASAEERESISEGKDACWLTPGWLKYRRYVFHDWDKGLANGDFPDWMGIPLEPYTISLNRLKSLLLDQIWISAKEKMRLQKQDKLEIGDVR